MEENKNLNTDTIPIPYKGFKSRRAFLNYQLHALSVTICGDRYVLDNAIVSAIQARFTTSETPYDTSILPQVSALFLTDEEAERIFKTLTKIAKDQSKKVDGVITKAGIITDRRTGKRIGSVTGTMTDKQRCKIIAISKYKLHWSAEAIFSYILDTCKHLRARLSAWEIKNSKLNKLFSLLSFSDADKVIKRLEKIEKRNSGQSHC